MIALALMLSVSSVTQDTGPTYADALRCAALTSRMDAPGRPASRAAVYWESTARKLAPGDSDVFMADMFDAVADTISVGNAEEDAKLEVEARACAARVPA